MLTLSDRLHCSREQRQAGQTGAPSLGEDYDLCPAGDRGMSPHIYCIYFHLYIYTLQDVYTPLHLVPPTVHGLINAIENKYKISATNIRFLYRKNKDGIVAKVDDDMLRHYCNEDVFLMQVLEASFLQKLKYLEKYFQLSGE